MISFTAFAIEGLLELLTAKAAKKFRKVRKAEPSKLYDYLTEARRREGVKVAFGLLAGDHLRHHSRRNRC